MTRHKFSSQISPLIFVVAFILIALLQGCQKAPETPAASDKYRLVWNEEPTTNITVAWDQHEVANAEVMYGTADHGRKFWKYKLAKKADRILDKYEMTTQFAKLTNLEPDQEYYFVIKDDK